MSGGVLHKTLVYLGLKDEPDLGYDDFSVDEPTEPGRRQGRQVRRRASFESGDVEETPVRDHDDQVAGNVRSLPTGDVQIVRPGPTPAPATAPLRTPVVEILVFDDVEAVGARYRTGQPVLFDVAKAEAAIGRRVLDFVSGLTYISRGRLAKVAERAFLLVPEGMELPAEERDRLEGLGYRLASESEA